MEDRRMNIHDNARQLAAQARGTMSLSEAYAQLAKRAHERRRIQKENRARAIANRRLPYADQ